jgi:hypothetical protein
LEFEQLGGQPQQSMEIDDVLFDSNHYSELHPDAEVAVGSGRYSNPYMHYLKEGIFSRYSPNALITSINQEDIFFDVRSLDLLAFGSPARSIENISGDKLSSAELTVANNNITVIEQAPQSSLF